MINRHLQKRARGVVIWARKTGRLVRPKVCSECGTPGRRIEGHHDDYGKPLCVRWLCGKCHRAVHRAFNEKHPQRRLDIRGKRVSERQLNKMLKAGEISVDRYGLLCRYWGLAKYRSQGALI